jgi:hypothetical protein
VKTRSRSPGQLERDHHALEHQLLVIRPASGRPPAAGANGRVTGRKHSPTHPYRGFRPSRSRAVYSFERRAWPRRGAAVTSVTSCLAAQLLAQGDGEYEITVNTSSVALTKYVRHASTRGAARAEERRLKQARTDEALPVAHDDIKPMPETERLRGSLRKKLPYRVVIEGVRSARLLPLSKRGRLSFSRRGRIPDPLVRLIEDSPSAGAPAKRS